MIKRSIILLTMFFLYFFNPSFPLFPTDVYYHDGHVYYEYLYDGKDNVIICDFCHVYVIKCDGIKVEKLKYSNSEFIIEDYRNTLDKIASKFSNSCIIILYKPEEIVLDGIISDNKLIIKNNYDFDIRESTVYIRLKNYSYTAEYLRINDDVYKIKDIYGEKYIKMKIDFLLKNDEKIFDIKILNNPSLLDKFNANFKIPIIKNIFSYPIFLVSKIIETIDLASNLNKNNIMKFLGDIIILIINFILIFLLFKFYTIVRQITIDLYNIFKIILSILKKLFVIVINIVTLGKMKKKEKD